MAPVTVGDGGKMGMVLLYGNEFGDDCIVLSRCVEGDGVAEGIDNGAGGNSCCGVTERDI